MQRRQRTICCITVLLLAPSHLAGISLWHHHDDDAHHTTDSPDCNLCIVKVAATQAILPPAPHVERVAFTHATVESVDAPPISVFGTSNNIRGPPRRP